MDLTVDVQSVSLCLIMIGTVNAGLTQQECAFCALKKPGSGKDIVVQLNDSGTTFDETADYLDRIGN